ncbi:transcriptional regulator [Pueribacillus theae]|uniref:Transcriptional regulator n=2 Tax=Pueribacillus theae TaxID=2171751 RepID=A0A2U1K0P8_9BACI|nr:transcriptional regulator [Pueribacillus theae]
MNKNASKRKEQLLRATYQALSVKGFSAVTLQDISDYAGVSKGVTNYYFKNKDDVLYQTLEWVTNKIYHDDHTAISKETTAMNKLRTYMLSTFSTPKRNRRVYKVYLDFLAQAVHNPRYLEINNQFYENCWSIGREIVSLGIKEGVFYSQDIDNAAITIRTIIDGCLTQWLMRDNEKLPNRDQLHDFYRKICFEAIVGFLTNENPKKLSILEEN